jgi:type II secretory pathway component PulF
MLVIAAIILLGLYIYLGYKESGIVLVTSPFVAGTLFIVAAAEEDYATMTVAPLICLATLLTAATSRIASASHRDILTFAGWILIILVLSIFFVIACIAFAPFGVTGILFIAFFLGSLIAYRMTSQHVTVSYFISTIGASMRQNLPLPMALESAAGGRTDNRARVLQQIQKWLVRGCSLSESIRQGYPRCPAQILAMIAAAERIDQLPTAIKAIEADMVTRADDNRKVRPVHPLYPLLLMVFMVFVLFGIMLFVIPSFKSAIQEMTSGQLPASTRLLLSICRFFYADHAWLIALLFAIALIVAVPVQIYVRLRPRRPQDPYLLSRISDFVKWHLPILHHFEKNYSMIQVVELLRLSLNSGSTVDSALDSSIGLDVNNRFRKRLQRCLDKVQRGDNVATAIRESRLGTPLAWAFDEKINQGNTMSILETLESFYRCNYNYRINLARFIIWPCVILVIGATVGFVVYAVFSPGIQIIKDLTEMVTP